MISAARYKGRSYPERISRSVARYRREAASAGEKLPQLAAPICAAVGRTPKSGGNLPARYPGGIPGTDRAQSVSANYPVYALRFAFIHAPGDRVAVVAAGSYRLRPAAACEKARNAGADCGTIAAVSRDHHANGIRTSLRACTDHGRASQRVPRLEVAGHQLGARHREHRADARESEWRLAFRGDKTSV
jgi:hypothetical protein